MDAEKHKLIDPLFCLVYMEWAAALQSTQVEKAGKDKHAGLQLAEAGWSKVSYQQASMP